MNVPEAPSEIIKDPMYLEFLDLKREAKYYEDEVESALIQHLQEFLLIYTASSLTLFFDVFNTGVCQKPDPDVDGPGFFVCICDSGGINCY